MFRTKKERRQDIIALDYRVMVFWENSVERARIDLGASSPEWFCWSGHMNRWCDRMFGPEAFAWTAVYDPLPETMAYWFVCPEFAFEFKMNFG